MCVCVCVCVRACVCVSHCVYFRRLRLREERVGFIIQYERSPALFSVQSFNELDTAQHDYRLNTHPISVEIYMFVMS